MTRRINIPPSKHIPWVASTLPEKKDRTAIEPQKHIPWVASTLPEKKDRINVPTPQHVPMEPLPGIMPPQVLREFRGVSTAFDPLSTDDRYFTDMSNLTSDDYPAISVRPGYTVLGSAIGTKVLGMGVWKDAELHAVFDDGTWRKWTGSAWSSALVSGLDTNAAWSFTNFQGNLSDINLIGANGVDGLHRYDGSTVQTYGNAPAALNYVTTYQNRIWGANGKELLASKLDDGGEWNSFPGTEEDSYGKQLESSRGENINMLSGSLSKLTIGMPNAIHELYGGVPSDFNTHVITERQGVLNHNSLVEQGGIARFLHTTGIFEYGGASLPDKGFSENVTGYLDTVTDSAAGSDGRKMYFRADTRTLVYDPRNVVRTWNVWTGLNAACFALMKGDLYIGDNSGRVLKIGGSTDGGDTITWHAVTKPFTMDSIVRKQRWLKLWLVADLDSGSTINVYLSSSASGDADWELVQSLASSGMEQQRIMIPVGRYAIEHYIRIKLEGSGAATLHEITRQVRELHL